jgi:hypothetical protein
MKKTVANNAETTKKPGGVTGKGFRPGRSGNPSGRPKSADFAEEVRDFLAERDPKAQVDQSRLRGILERLAQNDPKVLLHYGFGKPTDMGVEGGGSTPVSGFDPAAYTTEELIALRAMMAKGVAAAQCEREARGEQRFRMSF